LAPAPPSILSPALPSAHPSTHPSAHPEPQDSVSPPHTLSVSRFPFTLSRKWLEWKAL
jgi:hypothetical protein